MAEAVADFDGTGDYIDLEALDATGAFTVVAVIERDGNGTWDAIATHQTSADAFRISMALTDGDRLQLATHNGTIAEASNSSQGTTPFTVQVANGWVILVCSKPAGGSDVTYSRYASGSWTHTTATGDAVSNAATISSGKVRLGRYENTDDMNGKIAAYAIWVGTALNTTQVETLDGGDKQTWKSVGGGYTDLVEPGVLANGTVRATWTTSFTSELGLLDYVTAGGNGTIVTGDLPGSGIYTISVQAGGGTDATVTAAVADATGDSPDSVVTGSGDTTQVSPAADGTGALPAPTVTAGSVVTAVAATALGSAPLAGNEVSVEIGAPAATAVDGSTAPGVSGTGGAEVVAVPADATGALATVSVAADALVTAVVADATGTSPAQTVSGELAALITAVPADCVGYIPAPLVSDGTVPDTQILWLPSIPVIPEIPVLED